MVVAVVVVGGGGGGGGGGDVWGIAVEAVERLLGLGELLRGEGLHILS